MKRVVMALIAVSLISCVSAALTKPIDGTINFNGSLQFTKDGATSPTLTVDEATGLKFAPFSSYAAMAVTGDYSAIPTLGGNPPGLTFVKFTDFDFSKQITAPFVAWSLDFNGRTYDFLMDTVTADKSTGSLVVTGHGMLEIFSSTGANQLDFDPTPGDFLLTTQGGSGIKSFSATSTVPEPGTLVLSGLGFLCLALFQRRRNP